MNRNTSKFVCQQCGYEASKWYGKCPDCGNWGSLVETVVTTTSVRKKTKTSSENFKAKSPVSLAKIPARTTNRVSTKIPELDRVLGGGLVSGQVVLLAGEPGIGKSTLLLQLADKVGSFLYISAEESVNQIKLRATRLKIKRKTIHLMEETDIDQALSSISNFDEKVDGVVFDSIQTMYTSDLSGMAGSVGQVRECTYRLVRLAKTQNIPVFLVGHVTKQGSVAGPATLMHLVDTVLWFEGDKALTFRLLRAVKNRFGPTDEVGIFSMGDAGLISVSDPTKLFLSKHREKVSGSSVVSIMEGTRPILVEIQALVVSTKTAYPKRISQGFDLRRFELLLAVITRRLGLPLYDFDCYINVVGGVLIKGDPSADLAICLSIISSYLDKPLPSKLIAVGEVGLLGEIREVQAQEKRLKEAKRLGFTTQATSGRLSYLREAVKKYLR